MFSFTAVNDIDLDSYAYELYDNELGEGTPIETGRNKANVFTVSVQNSSLSIPSGEVGIYSASSYWGRVAVVNSAGIVGSFTELVGGQPTPLIGDQYLETLTAAKITAGTIGAHTITLAGANSIIKSSNYNPSTPRESRQGWFIDGQGNAEFSSAAIRGTISAQSIYLNSNNRWGRNSANTADSNEFKVGTDTSYLFYDFANNKVEFTGTITIGSSNNVFKADNNGIYLGNATFGSAPFRVSASGVLTSKSTTGSDVYTTTLTNAAYRNEFFDSTVNAYAVFTIGSTVLNHTGYFVNTGNLADTSIRERIVYQTNGIYMDARRALGASYSDGIVYLATERIDTTGQQRTRGRLQLESRNDTNASLNYVNITDGTVDANVVFFAGGFPRGGNNTGAIGGPPPTFSAWNLVASYNFFTASDGRFKDNQKELPLGLSFINKLQPIEYTNLAPRVIKARLAKEGEEQEEDVFEWDIGSRLRAGFTAQNVQEALISEDVGDYNLWSMADKNDPDSFQMLDYTQLIAPVVQAIKEIDIRLRSLEDRLKAFEGVQ
jgi:hypothetical protein